MNTRIVYGLQPVREAIKVHGSKIDRALIDVSSKPLEALARYAKHQGIEVETCNRGRLDKETRNGMHQGALVFAPPLNMVEIEQVNPSLVIALDGIEDPQNFGAVIRSSVALGASAVLWPEHHSAPLSPATFRASAGAIEHATLCKVPALPEALEILRARGAQILGLDMDGEKEIQTIEPTPMIVLVAGAEGRGLSRPVKAIVERVRLPMRGPIASLNVSVAVGIALYAVITNRGK